MTRSQVSIFSSSFFNLEVSVGHPPEHVAQSVGILWDTSTSFDVKLVDLDADL